MDNELAPVRRTRPNRPIQGIYWMATIPKAVWQPPAECPEGIQYLKGQLELGESGYEHWQLVVAFCSKKRLRAAKQSFPLQAHLELTYSQRALEYVWKDDTRVDGTQFEIGEIKKNRNQKETFEEAFRFAVEGKLTPEYIPADILVRHWSSLNRIHARHARPTVREGLIVELRWGVTGSGKTHDTFQRARELSGGDNFFIKSSRTKWWDGYQGETTVIVDEFRGAIDVTHLLIWLQHFACSVEIKGSTTPLKANVFLFTSNLEMKDWYPELDPDTFDALRRRFNLVSHYRNKYVNR